MSLEDEVARSRRKIRSDGYAMSIGEITNMYRDQEIVIRPEFQRLFRWPIEKQSRLVESLLLDIPVPTIFVSQRDDGVWELIDGLQRISTILKFMGLLRDEDTGRVQPQSTLVRTRYLPSLEGVSYDSLPVSIKVHLKRARLDFRILLRESDDSTRFELFDRLNSGGVQTSPQEVRTALTIMTDPTFYRWLDDFRREISVVNTLALTERQLAEQYDLELVARFLAIRHSTHEELSAFADMDSFLTERMLDMASNANFDRAAAQAEMWSVFDIAWALGPDVFRKHDVVRGKSVGAFSVSAFEAVTAGLARNLANWQDLDEDAQEARLRECVQNLWTDPKFLKHSGAGVRASSRVPRMPEVGARIFTTT